MLEALIEIVILMAIYDGAIVPQEREWLLCVAKATDLAGDAADVVKERVKNIFGRSERWGTQH